MEAVLARRGRSRRLEDVEVDAAGDDRDGALDTQPGELEELVA